MLWLRKSTHIDYCLVAQIDRKYQREVQKWFSTNFRGQISRRALVPLNFESPILTFLRGKLGYFNCVKTHQIEVEVVLALP